MVRRASGVRDKNLGARQGQRSHAGARPPAPSSLPCPASVSAGDCLSVSVRLSPSPGPLCGCAALHVSSRPGRPRARGAGTGTGRADRRPTPRGPWWSCGDRGCRVGWRLVRAPGRVPFGARPLPVLRSADPAGVACSRSQCALRPAPSIPGAATACALAERSSTQQSSGWTASPGSRVRRQCPSGTQK